MVVRMRDLLPARGPIAAPARVIDVKAFFTVMAAEPMTLKLVLLPRRNTDRRKLRSQHLLIDIGQRLALLEALLEPSEDPVIPERAQPYEGPVKGLATRIGKVDGMLKGVKVDVMVSAAAPDGFKENPGDVFLTIAPVTSGFGSVMTFRLDRGAKRFLISQLEQSITIEGMHFETAARRNWLQRVLDRARAYLKETGAE